MNHFFVVIQNKIVKHQNIYLNLKRLQTQIVLVLFCLEVSGLFSSLCFEKTAVYNYISSYNY